MHGNLHYPNDIDRSLNEAAADKIRKYRADYDNNPPSTISFMTAIASTSGRIHSEFIRLLFLQAHRETDRFFTALGVQLAQSTSGFFHFRRAAFSSQVKVKVGSTLAKAAGLRVKLNIDGAPITYRTHVFWLAQSTSGQFHFRHAAFSSQLKPKVGNILDKAAALRITLNIDGAPIDSKSHTHPSHSQTSRLLTSSLSFGVPVPRVTQSIRVHAGTRVSSRTRV